MRELSMRLMTFKTLLAFLVAMSLWSNQSFALKDSGKGKNQKNHAANVGDCAMGLDEAALLAQSLIGNSGQVLAAKKKKDKKGVCGIRIKVLSGDGVVRWIKLPSGRGN
jgi:hypothetical protein